MDGLNILFEDDFFIAVKKDAGLISEESGNMQNVPALIKQYFKDTRQGGGVFTVHRLDRATEGVIFYAKSPAAAAKLSDAVRRGAVEKTYLALAEGVPDAPKGVMNDLLFFDRRKNKSFVVKKARRGVKKARLEYALQKVSLIDGAEVSLLKIRLLTGRTHQIRVQLASRKMPILGDRRYGSTLKREPIALCSHEVTFIHPFTGEKVTAVYTPDFAT